MYSHLLSNILSLFNFKGSPASIPYNPKLLLRLFIFNLAIIVILNKIYVSHLQADSNVSVSMVKWLFAPITSELCIFYSYYRIFTYNNIANRFVQFAIAYLGVQLLVKFATIAVILLFTATLPRIEMIITLAVLLWQVAAKVYVIESSIDGSRAKAITIFLLANIIGALATFMLVRYFIFS